MLVSVGAVDCWAALTVITSWSVDLLSRQLRSNFYNTPVVIIKLL